MASSSQSMFGNAVSRVLNSWTALQLAVEHHFGGADSRAKADWMVVAIETWFKENAGIEQYEMEDFLEDVLNAEFDLKVEDNSIQEISHLICLLFRLCQENKVAEVEEKLQALPKPAVQQCRRGDDEMVGDVDILEEEWAVSPNRTSFSSQHHGSSASLQPAASSDNNMEEMEVTEEKKTDEDGWQVISRGKRK
ncbi:unnamed protein product [Candidula unifasciata]|uniref:Pre-rRNA-processing protein TSR2 homolog n=1 Tax=Candidula unifasciata TaxID=100452 RepID=A0A8S3ZR78_9EUPU|nr:unnamed protein product [Candidula unifasciata]